MRSVTRTLIALVCAAALHAEAQTLDEIKKQLSDAELALFKSRITLPDCSAAPATELTAYIQNAAKRFHLKSLTIQPAAIGQESPVRLDRIDLTGQGPFDDVDELLRRIAMQRLARILDFETMSIAAADGGTVTLNARIVVGCWSEPPAPPRPEVHGGDLITAMYRQRLDTVRSWLSAVTKADERFQPEAVLNSLGALDKDWQNRAAVLTEFQLNQGTATLRGVVIGAQARAELDSSLKNAGFDAGHVITAAAGDCHAFTATAHVVPDESRPHDLAFRLFDERASALCNAKPAQPPVAISGHGTGTLTLHLRDAEVADFFFVLNSISPHDAFIIEPGVKGRVNADLENVTAAEALAEVKKSGAAFVGPGPLHRVCPAACGAPTASSKKYDGAPISLSVRDAEVLDILRVFEKITGIAISVPRTLDGRIGVFAQDEPWDRVFEGIVSAFHLTYTLKGDRIIIGHGDTISVARAAEAHVSDDRRPWATLRDFERVGADDIHLAALAGTGDTWNAYAHLPGSPRTLVPLEPGRKLFDATVTAIGPTGVTLKTSGGRTTVLSLP